MGLRRLWIIFTWVFLIFGLPLVAKSFQVDFPTSELEFTAIGKPGFLRINGKNGKISGTAETAAPGKLSATLETVLDDFKTGISLRDEHMKKKYLETEKYPKAVLKLDASAIDLSLAKNVPFEGKLTLHGVERRVSGKANVTPKDGGKTIFVEAIFPIKLSDFKIDVPRYMGVTLAEDVEVRARLSASARQEPTRS